MDVNTSATILLMAITLPVIARRRGACCEVEPALTARRAKEAGELLKVLADPTRLSMLATLARAAAPVCVCDFAAAYGLSQPTISHHMGKLRAAGLVDSHREGVWVYYRAVEPLPGLVNALLASLD
jgi:ArsR family transcriptional regulator